jgi:hypothetical protein
MGVQGLPGKAPPAPVLLKMALASAESPEEIGLIGFQGIQGLQGVQGFSGFQGPLGFQGFYGFQGPWGLQGLAGKLEWVGVPSSPADTGKSGDVAVSESEPYYLYVYVGRDGWRRTRLETWTP